jgi:hypothetical protein
MNKEKCWYITMKRHDEETTVALGAFDKSGCSAMLFDNEGHAIRVSEALTNEHMIATVEVCYV